MIRFGLQLRALRRNFFDRQVVTDKVEQARRNVLSRYGYFVMRDARQSIRRRKRNSRPGQAPTNRSGLLKQGIFFAYDPDTGGVVVGPVGSRSGGVPPALEYGGSVYNVRAKRMTSLAARPFMRPAEQRQRGKLPRLWENSIR